MKVSEELATEIMSHQATRDALDSLADLFDLECEKNGITKTQFAEKIGRDPSYVSRILNGRASNFTFLSLARMFIALGYWPEIKAKPLSDSSTRANYMPEHVESPKVTYRNVDKSTVEGALTRNVSSVKVKLSPATMSQAS